ncbi:MAG: hypothetical protein ACLU8W_10975 [Clostridia bacterium]
MKVKLKPWQIGLIAAAGVVVLGGVGTGIYFGVNRSIDDKVKEQVDAAMESVYSSEAALDESKTPTQAAGETTAESTTAAQPTKEPETVIYVAPTETAKSETSPAPDPQPEPEPEPEIELVYDEKLTKEVAGLISKRYPQLVYSSDFSNNAYTLDDLMKATQNLTTPLNSMAGFAAKLKETSPENILSAWTECFLIEHCSSLTYNVHVYCSTTGWVCVTLDVG